MHGTEIELRALRAEDTQQAAAVIRAAFASNATLVDPPASASSETAESLRAWLERGGGAVAVARDAVVGVVLWEERDSGLYIGRLAVLPEWRRRGIARRLLARAETAARDRSLRRLHLGTRLVLIGSRRLFASVGFVEVSQHAHNGFDHPTWVAMEKPVG